jgi:GTP-binding protein HflX
LTTIVSKSKIKAVLVSPYDYKDNTVDSRIDETTRLAQSLKIEPFLYLKFKIKSINRKYFISDSIISYLHSISMQDKDIIVIFNCDLSAAWQRNIEKAICSKVIDRTELILDIFADRARSFEGKLQVELAQLKHMSSRLVRVWTHLERQKGGIGLRGGPGEKQIETDRRIIRKKIDNIEKKLSTVVKTRLQNRGMRVRNDVKTIALVGYTNAGKSTLFNRLTKKSVLTQDMPFASLDTTSGKIYLGDKVNCILIDTVGFINELPKDLLNAFKSSLEEINNADIIIHLIDINDKNYIHNRECVNSTIYEILDNDTPVLEVYNKVDSYSGNLPSQRFCISAERNIGIDNLKSYLAEFFNSIV